MNSEKTVPINRFWAVIEANAQLAQKHLDWELYLLRIKAAVEMIESRMEQHQSLNGQDLIGANPPAHQRSNSCLFGKGV